jgi:deazaflavin-dependent oxidoreductase (nitroreductase family)
MVMIRGSATKARWVRALQRRWVNPVVRRLILRGLLPGHALLETIGRITGERRLTPVGNGLSRDGSAFWIVAEHGSTAHYVRNIEAEPRVRLCLGREWRTGRARIVRSANPHSVLAKIGRRGHAAAVRALGTDLLAIRIDLDTRWCRA